MSEPRDEPWEAPLQIQPSLWSDATRPEGTWITVIGDSMLPTLPPGTRVNVRAKRAEPLRIGDVVLFVTADGERGVVHRVLFCLPGLPWIVQSGDRNRQRGSVAVIHRKQIVGVADLPRMLPSPHQCRAMLLLGSSRLLRPFLFFGRR